MWNSSFNNTNTGNYKGHVSCPGKLINIITIKLITQPFSSRSQDGLQQFNFQKSKQITVVWIRLVLKKHRLGYVSASHTCCFDLRPADCNGNSNPLVLIVVWTIISTRAFPTIIAPWQASYTGPNTVSMLLQLLEDRKVSLVVLLSPYTSTEHICTVMASLK